MQGAVKCFGKQYNLIRPIWNPGERGKVEPVGPGAQAVGGKRHLVLEDRR